MQRELERGELKERESEEREKEREREVSNKDTEREMKTNESFYSQVIEFVVSEEAV